MDTNLILITGGTGYIGSHVAVNLINEGYDVIIIDNLSNSSISVLDNIKNITGKLPYFESIDLCDKDMLKSFFNFYGNITAVIHFAAFKSVSESIKNPLKYYDNNITGLVNLLQNMKEHNINNLIFSSSCTVYGACDSLVSEDQDFGKAQSPYGHTKQIGEDIIKSATKTTDLEAISLRYFNPIGAHPSALIGELPIGPPTNLVPCITQYAAKERDSFTIYGTDYNTHDGTAIRDYIDVNDLASAHLLALKRLLKEENLEKYDYFNIGTGEGVSVLDIYKLFKKVSGIDFLPWRSGRRREGDVESVYAETQKAMDILKWIPETDIEETILSAWNWQLKLKK